MKSFQVFYSDGSSQMTSMAEGVTLEEARRYFVGQVFAFPARDQFYDTENEREHHVTAIGVEPGK